MTTQLYAANPQQAPAAPALEGRFASMPSAAELKHLEQRATEAVQIQDAEVIRAWKTRKELDADCDLAEKHRTDMRAVQAKRNAFEIEQAERELATDQEVAKAKQRDVLDAIKAKDKLRALTSATAFLGAQYRSRRLSLVLAAAPAVAGVIIGTVQAQDAWSRVMHLAWTNPVWWVLFLLESLATAPLVAILIFQAGKPGGSASAMRQAFAEMRKEKFAGIKVLLLGISVFINVAPHLILSELSGLIWLWVPVAVVLSLWLLPVLAAEFNERILTAKTDAELSAPAGQLSGEQAKLARQVRAVEEAELTGALKIPENEATAGAGSIRKVLANRFGSAGMPDAQVTRDWLKFNRTGELD
ncbi:hypothetical protein [Amycolatopsis sp. NPDC004378]